MRFVLEYIATMLLFLLLTAPYLLAIAILVSRR